MAKLSGIAGYRDRFQAAFGSPEITIDKVGQAIATFKRTLLSGNSAYGRYKAGNKTAMNAAQVRGMNVYFNKAKCDGCHEGINFTTNSYNNLGVGTTKPNPNTGRFIVTKVEYYKNGGIPNRNLDGGISESPGRRAHLTCPPKTLPGIIEKLYRKGALR